MRTLGGFCVALLCVGGLFAQYRNPTTPYIAGGFPSVVFPAGTPATVPGMTRFQPNVVYPGGGGPHFIVPNTQRSRSGFRNKGGGYGYGYGYSLGYAYPVYYGGFSDPSLYGSGYADQSAAPPQQGGTTVVYPPTSSGTAAPIIINIGTPPQPGAQAAPPQMSGPPPQAQGQDENADNTDNTEATHYLIAFKDHTIYSAIAYWVDGSTLHYFTSGNVHNQVSLSLVDRPLTERLNSESGLHMDLPQ